MSVAADLDYRFRPANRAQRALHAVVASRPGAWLFARTLPTLDTAVQRLTRHRHTVASLLAGLPVVDLTTTGRRTGRPRTTHLIAVPHHDTLALLGTNFGQRSTPAWVLNLEAEAAATLSHRGTTVEVVARPATEDEHSEILTRAAELYVGYRTYQARITGRRLRIFVMERAAD